MTYEEAFDLELSFWGRPDVEADLTNSTQRSLSKAQNAKEDMQLKIVKGQYGAYFVQGKGFTGTKAAATRFNTEAEADEVRKCAEGMGLGGSTVECGGDVNADPEIRQNADQSSFAVNFIRPKDIQYDGSIRPHRLNPSKRRFRTEAEANTHGARFTRIEGHRTFYVTKSTDPVNAWVNAVTGKTNPEIGRRRTYRA